MMKKFRLLFLLFIASLFFVACDSTSDNAKNNSKICPKCNMPLPKSNIHTAVADTTYFDDIGCMILWAKENEIDLKKVDVKVFSNDTKRYIDAKTAYYKINEITPMSYGFSAYEANQKDTISFDEVVIRMLRGEHMANPKIRKQMLGY